MGKRHDLNGRCVCRPNEGGDRAAPVLHYRAEPVQVSHKVTPAQREYPHHLWMWPSVDSESSLWFVPMRTMQLSDTVCGRAAVELPPD